MSNNWLQFLQNNGASFNSENEVSFSSVNYDNSPTSSASTLFEGDLYITDLSWLSLIEVRGADNKTFLQGQLTNDINAVSPTLSQLSGLCTPKGRLKALFSIFPGSEEKLYLQLPFSLVDETLKRLKMFILMSKVELIDTCDTIIKIGIYGEQSEKYLRDIGFSLPQQVNMLSQHDDMQLIRLHSDKPRFECIGSSDKIQKLWDELRVNAQLLNTEHWKLLDIRAGIPNIFPETKEVFIPQMLNLQILDGINFKKGCYTGQEVVARMQYLGKLKRQMYLAHCDTMDVPLPGSQLYSAATHSDQGTGNIVDAQLSPNGGVDLLAVISNEAAQKNDIYLDPELLLKLTLQEMPYSLNVESNSDKT